MNRITIATIALVGVATLTAYANAAGGPSAGRGPGNRQGVAGVCDDRGPGQNARLGTGQRKGQGRLFDSAGTPLSEEEEQGLLSMRQEEKLARDVYQAMYEKWRLRAFRNIARAEQQHMNAIGRAIERYDLDDPIADDAPGVFADPKFTALYDELVTRGSASLLEAVKAGALIEEMDIADLREELESTSRPDLQRVYENLLRGSRNHLRAFAGRIKRAGGSYEAEYLSQEDFDRIAASPHEPGTGRKAGNGRGTGQNAGNGRGTGQNAGRGGGRGTGRYGRRSPGRN